MGQSTLIFRRITTTKMERLEYLVKSIILYVIQLIQKQDSVLKKTVMYCGERQDADLMGVMMKQENIKIIEMTIIALSLFVVGYSVKSIEINSSDKVSIFFIIYYSALGIYYWLKFVYYIKRGKI